MTSVTPARLSWRRMISRIGSSPTGINGLGITVVYGRRRVPLPPARMTACMARRLPRVQLRLEQPEVGLDEIDGLPEPIGEGVDRPPLQQLSRHVIVADEVQHFAVRGPHAVLVEDDGEIDTHQRQDEP